MKNAILCVLCLGVFVYVMNSLCCFSGDDCIYGASILSSAGHDESLFHYLAAIFSKTVLTPHRPLAHFCTRFFTGQFFGKEVWDVCNTVMFCFLMIGIIRGAFGFLALTWRRVILLIFLSLVFLCDGECYLFCAGSCNYLWSCVATLLFLTIFHGLGSGKHSIWQIGFLVPVVMFLGGWQESFSLPVCFALFFHMLIHRREVTWEKMLICIAYCGGAFLLVLTAYWRMEQQGALTLIKFAKSFCKIVVNATPVWVVVVLLIVKRDRGAFCRRNEIELLVILGSLLMMFFVGFCGVRSIWISYVMSTIIILREYEPSSCVATGLGFVSLLFGVTSILYATRIMSNFEDFKRTLINSEDGVTCHEYVNCSIFARNLYQNVYRWTPGLHECAAAQFYAGRDNMISLTKELYEGLYKKDEICVKRNRLGISGEFYTTCNCNAIVMPVRGERIKQDEVSLIKYEHVYEYPRGIVSWTRRQWRRHDPLFVAFSCSPNVLNTNHGQYLLLPKEIGGDMYLKALSVDLSALKNE